MAAGVGGTGARTAGGADRRDVVLTAALETFLRYGFRKTSMADIADAAGISRPGLYFLFASKRELFAAAITRALEEDLRTAARALHDEGRPLRERLLDAFDTWTGRYLGAVGGELSAVADAHGDVLGTAARDSSERFRALVTAAVLTTRAPRDRATSLAIARTLISAATGLKHQTTSRAAFREDLGTAIGLLLPEARRPASARSGRPDPARTLPRQRG